MEAPYSRNTAYGRDRPLRRALIVEADFATRRLCRAVLEEAGFTVEEVDSGIAGVVAARQSVPDLVLIALQLPDVPGRQAIAWLRSNPALRATPILILGAAGEDGAKNGRDTLLRKPFTPAALRRTIRHVVS